MRRLSLGPAWRSVVIPIVGLVLFATALFLALVSDFARQQDRAFVENSERLVINAVRERVRALENIAADFAVWNDAYNATRPNAWDQNWLDENYYSNVTDGLFILNQDGRALYAWASAPETRVNLSEAVVLAAGALDLAALPAAAPDAIAIITRHAVVAGAPALVSFTEIAPEQDGPNTQSRGAGAQRFLAIVDLLQPEEIAAIGDARDVTQLQFMPSNDPAQQIALPWSNDSEPLGYLTWARERPGSIAFSRQLPPILAGLFLIAALTLLLTRRLVSSQVSAQVQTQCAIETSRLKSEFIATMSHELRTPLNAIIGYTELIQEEASGDSAKAIHDDANAVLDAARHLNRLVNNILDQSRIDAGRLHLASESVEVREILGELEELMAPLARANRNNFALHASEAAGAVQADPVRLQQCLVNLTSNALKFTRGGQVSVNVSARDLDGVRMICFEIRDTGIGIAENELERLFKPFAGAGAQSSESGFATTGLSLSITRSLARAMHGDVQAKSALGAGSVFTLMLPSAQATHNAAA